MNGKQLSPMQSTPNKGEYVIVSKRELAMLKREIKISNHYTADLFSQETKTRLSGLKRKSNQVDDGDCNKVS